MTAATTTNGASVSNMEALAAYEATLADPLAQIERLKAERAANKAADDQLKAALADAQRAAAGATIKAAAEALAEVCLAMAHALDSGDTEGALACYEGSSNGLFYSQINTIKANMKHLR